MTQAFRYFVEAIEDYGHDGGLSTSNVICELPHELTINDHDIIEELVGTSLKNNSTGVYYDLVVIPLEEAIVKISKDKTIPYVCICFNNGVYEIQNENFGLSLRSKENISQKFNIEMKESCSREFQYIDNSPEYWAFSFRKLSIVENNRAILCEGRFDGDINELIGFNTSDNYIREIRSYIENQGNLQIFYYPEQKKYIVINNIVNQLHIIDEKKSKIENIIKLLK
jgi:hypothetical protein